jgi:hypothetical protein
MTEVWLTTHCLLLKLRMHGDMPALLLSAFMAWCLPTGMNFCFLAFKLNVEHFEERYDSVAALLMALLCH